MAVKGCLNGRLIFDLPSSNLFRLRRRNTCEDDNPARLRYQTRIAPRRQCRLSEFVQVSQQIFLRRRQTQNSLDLQQLVFYLYEKRFDVDEMLLHRSRKYN